MVRNHDDKYAPTQHRPAATWNVTAEARRLESLHATLSDIVDDVVCC
jgi:hypothetical protein